MRRLPTSCEPIDVLLQGGVEYGVITQVYGEPGTGKTTLCLQLACNCVKRGKKVAYIDTESISVERLEQIGGRDIDYNGILIFKPYSLDEQEKMVKNATNLKDLGLIVVDTINMYLRLKYHEAPDECTAPILRQMETLAIGAHKNDYPVVITSQVYQSKEDGEIKAFGGLHTAYTSKTIIRLDRLAPGKRKVTIIKHRSIDEQVSAEFRLTGKGLE